VIAGGSVSFQVVASGTAPLGYQWLFDATNGLGSNTNTLVLSNAQPVQAGNYRVVVTNVAGAVTSAVATLTVGVPPAVVQQPTSLVVTQGQNAVFTVTGSGDQPLSYQWRFHGTNLGAATSSSLTVPGATPANSGNYDAVLTNPYGSATSSVAQLTVLVPPLIISQPTNQIVAAGGNATFQVAASGTALLSYQWLFNGTNAVGISTNTLVLSNVQSAEAGNYSVVVTNVSGAITSVVATLTVGVPPPIVTNIGLVVTTVSISINTVLGLNYYLEYKDNLDNSVWTTITPGVAGTGAILVIKDSNAVVARRFYRVRGQ
jgi:hypothetical protein